MISELLLRWVVTGLFMLSAAECGHAILSNRGPWTLVVSHGLHFVMSVAMVVMVWPQGAQLPATGPMLFFLLATAVFATMAVGVARTAASRLQDGYNALMMLATAWMYALMDGDLLTGGSGPRDLAQPSVPMPGMAMAGMDMPSSSGSPGWFSAVDWFGTVFFAIAAVFWIYRSFTQRPRGAAWYKSLGYLSQPAMAAGMAILFLSTLFPI
ncbi:DUF5134 domain-containing protein [Mycobacterium sp.]|uniref:DUF5134 domain-containing protein n=1 Tax=Mycobacterium sp. TaxID=1785 RepID=UPI001283A05C|nr:DUF5134 domain-containing protein [Mycobacterium sp.]KAA8969132.1 MAG: DUF5134 domain-containing protein [Mycobacterium sp.]